jgi:hypothetical protein
MRLYTKEIRSCSGLLTISIHEHYAWQGLVPRSRRAAWRQVTAVTGRPAISAITLENRALRWGEHYVG